MPDQKTTKKVIAAIIHRDGKVLIAQRAKEDSLKGKWEFPGGKLEAEETYQECLKRELFEELSIDAEIGDYACSSFFEYKGQPMEMMAFYVPLFSGELILHEHSHVQWVFPHELPAYEFPEADLPIVALLMKKGV